MENNLLTLAKAQGLIGKTIRYFAPAYSGNADYTGEITISGIISEWEYNKKQPMEGYQSRIAYWDSYMSERSKEKLKNTLLIMDEKGSDGPHYMRLYPGYDAFSISDADRYVIFEEI